MALSSSISLASLSVSEFASKPFVRSACAAPFKPNSVLSFFFGVDFDLGDEARTCMRNGVPLNEMMPIWYGASEEYDKLCQSFIPVVRDAGTRKLSVDSAWNDSIDGKVSQMLLCDQFARNCFRGSDEAFQYDSVAVELSLELCTNLLPERPTEKLVGEMYPPYANFLLLPLMHSESLANHDLGLEVVDWALGGGVPEHLHVHFVNTQQFLGNHREVIERFGRYPHRNMKLGRESTKEELEWLADLENLPGWAKSQG